MENSIKKLILRRTAFWIISSLIFSLVIYVLSGSITLALLVGFAFFLYSLSSIYIYYQYLKNEKREKQ